MEWEVQAMDEYFEYGNVRIKITEHFAETGPDIEDLLIKAIEIYLN